MNKENVKKVLLEQYEKGINAEKCDDYRAAYQHYKRCIMLDKQINHIIGSCYKSLYIADKMRVKKILHSTDGAITAGKPPLFSKAMGGFSANITQKHIEMASVIGRGNRSNGIRIALIRWCEDGATFGLTRWEVYFRAILASGPGEYADRKLSIRISIPDEIRYMTIKLATSVCGQIKVPAVSEGIRRALELYGLGSNCDADLVNKLTIIRKGLYKKNERK